MASRRKRQVATGALLRSRSVTPSGSGTGVHPSHRPSAARRALLMGLAMGDGREPSPPPLHNVALCVAVTPGGSVRPTGQVADVAKTPGGSLRAKVPQPQIFDYEIEIVEAMDLDEEEAEDVLATAPWHVQRWLQDLPAPAAAAAEDEEAEVCALSRQPLPSTSTAEERIGDVSGVVSVPVQNPNKAVTVTDVPLVDDVRPSVSGVTATSKRSARRQESEGSGLDSDFDDEFDRVAMESDALGLQGRREKEIPDDEELEEPIRDVIVAVEQAMDDAADRLPGVSTSYDWEEDFGSFRGVPEVFSGPTPGPIKDYDTPYDAFTDIWSMDIIERITSETNRYAKQVIESRKASGTLKPSSRLHQWVDTDADEILVYFSVLMYMGIDPRTSQTEFWVANDYLEMPKFKQLLTFNRFILLNKFLHFVDNTDVSQRSRQSEGNQFSAKLAKIQPVISHLNEKFASVYNLSKEISIDESLTLFKGRLSWVQTIRSKSARFGIKSYELCESRTGYMYRFQIYTGKGTNVASDVAPSEDLAGKSTAVVLDLLKGLEHLGHCVTMDNFYNCPALARYLKSLEFDCLGTLRPNRRNVPDAIKKVPKNMAKGTIIARHSGDVSIIAWKDSKVVTMISTYHTAETYVGSKAGKVLVKPVSVRDYNHTMGGVDLKDQKLSMYLLERKRCIKWYMKIFKRLLNVSIHNAFVMYVNSLRRRGKLPLTHREFRYALAKSLIDRHRRSQPKISGNVGEDTRLRRDVVHEPKHVGGSNNRKRCVVCFQQGKTKLVHTSCITCDVFLCFENCWRIWHSQAVLNAKERGRKRTRCEAESGN